ncbi:MAG: ATP-grasp domain-containing protein [Deltaproteobacteria bacterium]
MRFYESETKRILAKHGIAVPKSGVAKTAEEAERLASELGAPVVLKAQMLAHGKARHDTVKTADSSAAAKQTAASLLALDDGGRKPAGLLVEKRPAAVDEYTLAFTYDGTAKRPVMIGARGTGNVEEVAEKDPNAVARRHFSALSGFSDYLAKELVAGIGVKSADVPKMTAAVSRLAQLFLRYDLTQLDVVLGRLEDGSFVALDARSDMEVEGRPRQKAILEEIGIAESDRRLVREPTAFEIEAAKIDAEDPRGVAGPVVEFDGNIGLVIGAGGGSLTLTDAVRRVGGKPANYAALGGNPSVKKAQRLTRLILSKPGVKRIAVMSNVVSNTRADLVARGVIKGVIEAGLDPAQTIAIFRVPGAWEADAAKILEKYGVEYCDRTVSISEAAKRAVEKIGG